MISYDGSYNLEHLFLSKHFPHQDPNTYFGEFCLLQCMFMDLTSLIIHQL